MTTKPYHIPPPPENTKKNQPHTARRYPLRDARVAGTFRRATCARCEAPVIALGEAIRVERVEGGYEILHVCAAC
ncbi:MAG: hypothetical protein M3R15_24270, partial [Acidobacteriota bacterium]|nr:hypothetical protein [Acidobacteriota bacterium]